MKIAIQGIESSFHDMAAQKLFPNRKIQLVPCNSFDQVSREVSNFNADFGVLAIENTIAGSILPNYNLIDSGDFQIVEEIFLNIDMYVMALESESIHDIEEIHSHPVALQQCKDYLQRFPPHCKIIEGKDTASEARRIKENNLKGVAAIAGKQVAEKFGLKILDSKIQNIKENQTRFIVIRRKIDTGVTDANKATLKFVLNHKVGSLSNVLQMLSTFDINLTKIQSLPITGRPWQYAFFVDVLFSDYILFSEVIIMMEKAVKELKILGMYKQNLESNPSHLTHIALDGK
ncbi:prephenate dehydratase [Ulvibacter sp. MAR_2010_11]|uniref:prephenate dehydratase n=1 Tax=Ulvibacter sp. MAR_2010_11 TaxID=1250229 RepID=UPI000C2BAFFC|nr:prephenate dehydratase domain-containing protein [Ulvibacter sp. MAR_2010_11]PKA82394.1 prephenate dehydratase [Ulvibacter sp. MAR_2010_11]